jgi:hypothetical protein
MLVIYTADEILSIGLTLMGFPHERQESVSRDKNLDRFRSHYGSNPVVYAQIWEDLQLTDIEDARIDAPTAKSLKYFLMSINFLKCYPVRNVQEGDFGISDRTAREKSWLFLKKIQALKAEKVSLHYCALSENCFTHFQCIVFAFISSFSDCLAGKLDKRKQSTCSKIFLITVDGVHCHINEPTHPVLKQDPVFYSHKSNRAGLNYELGMSVYDNKLVWMNGPFPAGRHDINIFRTEGLKDKIPAGKLVIGDNGYHGEPNIISTPNSHDPPEVRQLKSRALSRHETFNGRIKNFACVRERFRHRKEYHKIVFEAVCVICQYQIEHEGSIFSV